MLALRDWDDNGRAPRVYFVYESRESFNAGDLPIVTVEAPSAEMAIRIVEGSAQRVHDYRYGIEDEGSA